MKKRLLASLLAGVMVLGTLAGCGGGSQEETTASFETEETTESENSGSASSESSEGSDELGEVTLVIANRDEFLSEMESGAIAAAEQLGIKLTTVDAQNDQSKLLQFVETAKND